MIRFYCHGCAEITEWKDDGSIPPEWTELVGAFGSDTVVYRTLLRDYTTPKLAGGGRLDRPYVYLCPMCSENMMIGSEPT
jgi:hypothetical protein